MPVAGEEPGSESEEQRGVKVETPKSRKVETREKGMKASDEATQEMRKGDGRNKPLNGRSLRQLADRKCVGFGGGGEAGISRL